MDGDDKTPHDAATDDAAIITPCEPWPDCQHTHQGTKLAKCTALRSSLQLPGERSRVKGQDERQQTAPLTPLARPMPLLALDKLDTVRDGVNPWSETE